MTSPSPAHEQLAFGALLAGRYRIGRELGRGAMGAVYRASHERLDRSVAIKVLLPELASDSEACERFEREARAASRVGSHHIVEVFDADALDDGLRYIVMEYLSGETLSARYRTAAPMAPEKLLPLALQLLDGLAAAHDAGIVHRDVKPDNVFLLARPGEPDHVKILDFGVSKFRDAKTAGLKSRTGVVLGTPHYMAPEQARGDTDVDRRADIYSAGVVLYEGLCGRRPFTAENVNQLLFRIVLEDVPSLTQRLPSIHPDLAAIVAKATAREPAQRYPSARRLADDLRAWFEGAPVRIEAPPSASEPSVPSSPALDEPTASSAMATMPGALPDGPLAASEPMSEAPWTATPLASPMTPAEAPPRRRFLSLAAGLGLVAIGGGAAYLTLAQSEPHTPIPAQAASASASAPASAPVATTAATRPSPAPTTSAAASGTTATVVPPRPPAPGPNVPPKLPSPRPSDPPAVKPPPTKTPRPFRRSL